MNPHDDQGKAQLEPEIYSGTTASDIVSTNFASVNAASAA